MSEDAIEALYLKAIILERGLIAILQDAKDGAVTYDDVFPFWDLAGDLMIALRNAMPGGSLNPKAVV